MEQLLRVLLRESKKQDTELLPITFPNVNNNNDRLTAFDPGQPG